MRGTGTSANPLIIETPQDLVTIATGTTHLAATRFIRLGNDIDMSGITGFIPIGSYVPSTARFRGNFNGMGFAIRNLTIESANLFVGLFGHIESTATVTNLSVIDAKVTGTGSTSVVGILAGNINGNVSKIFTSGTAISEGNRCGGIAAVEAALGVLTDSYSIAHVIGGKSSAGGIVSRPEHNKVDSIRNCYFAGTIDSTALYMGGAIGYPVGTGYKFSNVYYNSDLVTGDNLAEFDTPLTTSEMKTPSTFSTFSTDIWTKEEGKYPYITSLGEPVIVIPAQKVVANTTSNLEPFKTNSKLVKRKLETTLAFSRPIGSNVQRELVASCLSIVEAITSSATAKVSVAANTKTYTVTSTFSELLGSSTRVAKAIRGVDSYIDLIGSQVTVTIPVEPEKPIYANVYFKLSQSMASTQHYESITEYLNNYSNVTLITNKLDTDIKENATETSVI